MEYKRIISTLTYRNKDTVLPSRNNLWFVVLISTITLLLYIVATILYIVTIKKQDYQSILLSISIIETIITLFSIVVSFFATYVSNYVNSACIKFAEKINLLNEPRIVNSSIKLSVDLSRKVNNHVRCINIICAVIYSLYFVVVLVYYCNFEIKCMQFVSIGLGSISTILTIVLALNTTLSYYTVGKYFNLLLEKVKKDTANLSDEINNIKVSVSNNK